MRGRLVLGTVDAPAAGAEFSFTPSTTDRCRLLSVTSTLTAEAVAQNRHPGLSHADQNGTTYWSANSVAYVTASRACPFTWARGAASMPVVGLGDLQAASEPLPDLWLEPGDSIHSQTYAMAAADQWSTIVWRGIVCSRWEWLEIEERVARALGD